MKALLIILILILVSGCCVVQDIKYSIDNPQYDEDITHYVDVVSVYKPSRKIKKGDVYLNE